MAAMERVVSTTTGAAAKHATAAAHSGGGGGGTGDRPHLRASSTVSSHPVASAAATAAEGSNGHGHGHGGSAEEQLGKSQVFAQLRHGHVQVRMGGPARFALSTPRQLHQQQQEHPVPPASPCQHHHHHGTGKGEEDDGGVAVVARMRKHHTVHPTLSSPGGTLHHHEHHPHDEHEDGVPRRRGMTRQKTLDRLLHMRILTEGGRVIAPAVAAAAAATAASSQQPQQQQQQAAAAVEPIVKELPSVVSEGDEEAAAAAAEEVVESCAGARGGGTTPTPRAMPARQGSFFNQPSPASRALYARRRVNSSGGSSGSGGIWAAKTNGTTTAAAAATASPSPCAACVAADGEPAAPPSACEIRRSSSVIEDHYQVTASKGRLSVLSMSVLCLIAYLALAVAVYGYGLTKWGVVRALYFGVVTLTSVGFGDILPTTQEGRLFTIFFALIGISIVALAVGEISAQLIEHETRKVEEFQKYLTKRLNKKRSRRSSSSSKQLRATPRAGGRKPTEAEVEMSQHTVASSHSAEEDDDTPTGGGGGGGGSSSGNPRSLPAAALDLEAGGRTPTATTTPRGGGGDGDGDGDGAVRKMRHAMSLRDMAEAAVEQGKNNKVVKKIVHQLGQRRWSEILPMLTRALLPVLIVNAIGAGVIGYMEGWTPIDVAYYAVISSTTIGYGDLHPDTTATYLVAIFYIPLAVCAVGNAISQIADYYMQKSEEKRRAAVLSRKYVWEDLIALDENGDESIDIFEFTIYLLKLWGLVDDQILAAINERFKELDTDGSGTLTREDFMEVVLPTVDESEDGSDVGDDGDSEGQEEGEGELGMW